MNIRKHVPTDGFSVLFFVLAVLMSILQFMPFESITGGATKVVLAVILWGVVVTAIDKAFSTVRGIIRPKPE